MTETDNRLPEGPDPFEKNTPEQPSSEPSAPVEPSAPEKTAQTDPETEWAERLGLQYDAEEARRRAVPPPPPFGQTQTPPPPTPSQPVPPAPQQPRNIAAPENMPKTYLLWSVLSLVCCCFIPAIVAIVYSAQVSSRYYAGNYEGAVKASERAQIWIIVAIVLGLISNTLYIPISLMAS